MRRILFVYPPFGALSFPSIGLSILKACLVERELDCRIAYLNFDFVDRLPGSLVERLTQFDAITRRNELSMGDWIFAAAVYEPAVAAMLDARFSDNLVREGDKGELREACFAARAAVESFLCECVDAIDWSEVGVLGLHAIFNQTLAAIAIARRAKAHNPALTVLFGGPSVQGEVGEELLRSFPVIDYVVQGEAEAMIVEAAERALAGRSLADLPGVVSRSPSASGETELQATPAIPVENMDRVPVPDYDDYFERFRGRGYEEHFQPFIPIENARGCWWGAKQHCTFCGLNGEFMKFRSKSTPRVLSDIDHMIGRYGAHNLTCVDSILDMSYFDTLLPELKRRDLGVDIFYEVKANLSREQVMSLADAGVRLLQPGLEHLSTDVLRLMRKGTSFLQNVQLLKWCRERRLTVFWSILYGFPGEEWSHYAELPARIQLLSHLFPPKALVRVRADRFSPLQTSWRTLGISAIRPSRAYRHLYPFDEERLAKLAYHFDYDYSKRPADLNERIRDSLEPSIASWNEAYFAQRASLEALCGRRRTLIRDRRFEGPERLFLIEGRIAALYARCDSIQGRRSAIASYDDGPASSSESPWEDYLNLDPADLMIDTVLARSAALALAPPETLPPAAGGATVMDWLQSHGLIAAEGDRILALACRAEPLPVVPHASDQLRDMVNMSATRRLQLEGIEGLMAGPAC